MKIKNMSNSTYILALSIILFLFALVGAYFPEIVSKVGIIVVISIEVILFITFFALIIIKGMQEKI